MEWNAIITIYLAVGAPFAAARWLRTEPKETTCLKLASAILAAMVWPYIGLRLAERLGALSRESASRESDPER